MGRGRCRYGHRGERTHGGHLPQSQDGRSRNGEHVKEVSVVIARSRARTSRTYGRDVLCYSTGRSEDLGRVALGSAGTAIGGESTCRASAATPRSTRRTW